MKTRLSVSVACGLIFVGGVNALEFRDLNYDMGKGKLELKTNTLSLSLRQETDQQTLVVGNTSSGKSCQVPIDGELMDLYVSNNESVLAVISGYGSGHSVYFVESRGCKIRPGKGMQARTSIQKDKLVLDAYCGDGVCEGKNCTCWPSEIYSISPNLELTHLTEESFQHTKKMIGVGFSKKSMIDFPKSDKARVVK